MSDGNVSPDRVAVALADISEQLPHLRAELEDMEAWKRHWDRRIAARKRLIYAIEVEAKRTETAG